MGYGKKYNGGGQLLTAAIDPNKKPAKSYTPVGCLVALYFYPQDTTAGGLVMPEGVKNPMESVRCLVIAVGADCKWVKEGDEVILGNSPPMRCIHGGEQTFLVREDSLAGVVLDDYRTESRGTKEDAA